MEALKANKIIGNKMMKGLCFYFFQIPGNKGFKMRNPKLAHILVCISVTKFTNLRARGRSVLEAF